MISPNFQGLPSFRARAEIYTALSTQLRNDILNKEYELSQFEGRIGPKYCDTLRRFNNGFTTENLAEAGFRMDRENSLIRLGQLGLDRMMKELSRRGIQPKKRRKIQCSLVELYVLHEIRHISQNFCPFVAIQKIKQNVGLHAFGEIDLIADIDAAKVLAALQFIRDSALGITVYYQNFYDNLLAIGNIATPAFGAPMSRPHKFQRAMGIAISAARLKTHLENKFISGNFGNTLPLEAVIWPAYSELGSVSLMLLSPEYMIVKADASMDVNFLLDFDRLIARGQFEKSLPGWQRFLDDNNLL